MSVFGLFDGSYKENFLSAVLLSALETSDEAKSRFCALLTKKSKEASNMLQVNHVDLLGRESGLDVLYPDGSGATKRSDLYGIVNPRGPRGDAEAFIVEVKTRDNWDASHVLAQLRTYHGAEIKALGRKVVHVFALVPGDLRKELKSVGCIYPILTWEEVRDYLPLASSSESISVYDHAREHLDKMFVGPTGAENLEFGPYEVERFLRRTEVVQNFLVEAAHFLDGSVDGRGSRQVRFYLGHQDGTPWDDGKFQWYSIELPFKLDGNTHYIGVYHYLKEPVTIQSKSAGDTGQKTYVEIYLNNFLKARVLWEKSDLSPQTLKALRIALKEDFERRIKNAQVPEC